MSDHILDDPIWEYTLATRLQPYIQAVRRWWSEYEQLKIIGTGVMPIEYTDMEVPPGLTMRFTSTAVRSPIKNVQAFPFVPVAFLQITGVPGGVNRMVEHVCDKGLEIEEFKIIEKHNLPSTWHAGSFLAFIPKDVYAGAKALGKYVYLTIDELASLAHEKCPRTVTWKCAKYL